MWQMQRVYGVGGKLLKAVQSFYVDSRACVRVGNDVSEWFPVNVGLRQGCMISPWLFNVYMDGVVLEVNVWVLGKGLGLLSARDYCEWPINRKTRCTSRDSNMRPRECQTNALPVKPLRVDHII